MLPVAQSGTSIQLKPATSGAAGQAEAVCELPRATNVAFAVAGRPKSVSTQVWTLGVQLPAQPRNRVVLDRKSTRLNSSHVAISYAVFCLKKKTKKCWRGSICV